jgi:hypothetical protein
LPVEHKPDPVGAVVFTWSAGWVAARSWDGLLVVPMERTRVMSPRRNVTVEDKDGLERGRFAVPDHPRELSWTVLRSIESALAPAFGERWMEEK